MFVLSMQTDYAILALGYLSREGTGRLVSAREIAARYQMPSELLAKILQRLARQGVVRSNPGPAGGYALAASLARLTLADVLRVIEGPLHMVRCLDDTCCQASSTCDIVEPMRVVHDRIVALLENITVNELISKRESP